MTRGTAREYVGSVSPKGQITLPVEVRAVLGIKPKDKVIMKLEDQAVVVRRSLADWKAGYQSIPALKKKLSSKQIEEIAAEEHAAEAAREGL